MPIEARPLRHVSRYRLTSGDGNAPGLDGMELLFGGDTPQATPTQAAPPPSPEQPAPQGAPALDGMDMLFGGEQAGLPQQGAAEAPSPYAEPDADTWWQRRAQDVRGKKDPREANTGTVFNQFPNELRYPTANAATLGASDPQMADIIQKQLGDKIVRREQDANGYDVFVTRGPDGQEQRGYVNAPGLDSQDVSRTIYGALPYAIGGAGVGAATKGLGGFIRALTYAGTSGATSIAGDLAQIPMGSQQGVEPMKAAIAAGAGFLGVPAEFLASKAWGRFVVEPRLFNRSTGRLTPKGEQLARSQGLDPSAMEADIAKTFAQTYARTGDASRAAIQTEKGEFGIESSVGQRSKDPWQLTQEEAMRRNLYGDRARDTMKAFDTRQAEAVDYAARTRMPSDFRSQSVKQTGTMNPAGVTHVQQMPDAQALGTGIQDGMRSARSVAEAGEKTAWDAVTDILPQPQAFDLLPDALAGRLGGMRVTNEMPKAATMAKTLDDYVEGKALNAPVAKVLQQSPVKTIDEMRRHLLGLYRSADDPTDLAAAKAIYDGFNDWIDEAASQSLLAGDPAAAAKLRIARDTTRTMQELFNPSDKGRPTPAGKLMTELTKADSPERTVQVLFGPASSQNPSTIKPGAVEALRSMKAALRKYADPRVAGDTIADLKIAYWARLVQNKQGAAHTPGVMLGNIKAALANQKTLVQELFTGDEIGQMRRLVTQLERITYKPPNASGSGYTAAGLASQFFGKLFEVLGAKGAVGRTALEYTGLPTRYGAATAQRAVSQEVKHTPRNFLPYSSGTGATYGRNRDGAR